MTTNPICKTIGCRWDISLTQVDEGSWEVSQCSRCLTKGMPPWYPPFNEGWIPILWWKLKLWACGFFLGHVWESWEIADSGEFDSACDRCGIKEGDPFFEDDEDHPGSNFFKRDFEKFLERYQI